MGLGVVEVDLHGLNEWQAQVAVDSQLRRAGRDTYRLRLIHGYRHDTVLRDMIWYRYARHPRVLRLEPGENPGQTDLVLREL